MRISAFLLALCVLCSAVLAAGDGLVKIVGTSTSVTSASLVTGPDAYAITAGTGTGVTVQNAAEPTRSVYKVTTTYAAFAAAGLTADKTIATLPAKTRLCGLYLDVTQVFSGGTVATASLSLGTTAGGVGLLVLADVKTATVTLGLLDADLGTSFTRASSIQGCYVPSWSGTTTLSARMTTTIGNTNTLTQGSATWYVVVEALP